MAQTDEVPAPLNAGTHKTSNHHEADAASVAEWNDTYAAARHWVKWNARRRWPRFAVNDDVWAMSVASWHCGPRNGGAA